jgi:hypothetical protein
VIFRLQGADPRLAAAVNPATGTLEIRGPGLKLSGGTELMLGAHIRGAGLWPLSLAACNLTALNLEWRNDGRLPGLIMQAAGATLSLHHARPEAIKAAGTALGALVEGLPGAVFADDSKNDLARLVASLPQGKGRLRLSLTRIDGISTSRLIMAGLADAPLAPDTLEALFAGTSANAIWESGIREHGLAALINRLT